MNTQENPCGKTIVFRCDSSFKIGTGHILRCRTLARVLSSHGANIFFISKLHDGTIIDMIRSEFRVLTISNSVSDIYSSDDLQNNFYTSWLGSSQLEDVDATYSLICSEIGTSVEWIIVDHYALDHTWEINLLNRFSTANFKQPKILVIDDLANRTHSCDILLDQNYFSVYHTYTLRLLNVSFSWVPITLLGSEYSRHPITPARKRSIMFLFILCRC